MRKRNESELYPLLRKWMVRQFRCFKSGINVGLQYSRADVLGIRDVGGSLSGDIESLVIEVKRGTQPFATASGQAFGYKVYANRIYLADERQHGFTHSELDIASHLGIGLIQVRGNICREVLSSPNHQPIVRMSLELIERLALGQCQFCGTFFDIGKSKDNRFSGLTRRNVTAANELGKGLIFWNQALADRKRRLGIRQTKVGWSHERRFVCAECVETIFGPLCNKASS